ncbi:MAG: rhodanese-like domain-containing protein [Candidatus Zixiibacteriota bacterium]
MRFSHKSIPTCVLALIIVALFACVSADEKPTPGMPPNPVSQKLMAIVTAAKADLTSVDNLQLKELMESGEKIRLIDVRTQAEYDQGHIAGAEWFPRGTIDFDAMMGKLGETHETYILYCKKGPRAILAAKMLKDIGYEDVRYLLGGFVGWIEEGNSVYNRHGEIKVVDFEKKEPK